LSVVSSAALASTTAPEITATATNQVAAPAGIEQGRRPC
jgi:hypothetical protein